jgi:hypothetical protein
MGRRTAAHLRELGLERNWLDATAVMPEDEHIAAALDQPKRASTTISSLAAQRKRIQGWANQGVSGVAIFTALQREQGWSGSYSAAYFRPWRTAFQSEGGHDFKLIADSVSDDRGHRFKVKADSISS